MATEMDDYLGDLSLWEGVVRHMYLDTKGLVTVAIGHLLATPEAACALPFEDAQTKAPAAKPAIRRAWAAVKAMEPARLEASYAPATTLRLSQDQCFELAKTRLEREFLPALRRTLPGFDALPAGVRRAIVDVAWNYGVAGLLRTKIFFPQLKAHDWAGAAKTCERLDSRPLRNEWRARLLLA